MSNFMYASTGTAPFVLQSSLAIEEWQSNSMEPTKAFADLIHVTPAQSIAKDSLYMLHYQRDQIQPPASERLVTEMVKVIRHVWRLEGGLGFDTPHSAPHLEGSASTLHPNNNQKQ